MCKVYKIDFHSLSTVFYYTGQSKIVQDGCNSQKTFLLKCFLLTIVLWSCWL